MKETIEYIGNELENRIFDENKLVEIVDDILQKYKIIHTEVWQNPAMPYSLRIYNGAENLIMNFFFKSVTDEKNKKTRFIFSEILLKENMLHKEF